MPELEGACLGLDDRAENVALARDVAWPDTEGDWNAIGLSRIPDAALLDDSAGSIGRLEKRCFDSTSDALIARGRACFGRVFARPP